MRRGSVLAVRLAIAVGLIGAAPMPARANPSNPAFLGISFGPNPAGVEVSLVTPDSPASRGGLRPGDVIVAIDGHLVDVSTLNTYIIAHEAGDTIQLAINRDNRRVILTPTLTTRADMFDLLLGHPFAPIDLVDSESGHAVDLGKPSGHATVIGWYHTRGGGQACVDAVPLIRDIQRRVSGVKDSGAAVVGATYSDRTQVPDALVTERKRLGLPLLVTSPEAFSRVAIDECGRVFAMVIDCRGVVTFLTPITDGEDEDAALDEIAAAAAQADHRRR